MRHLSSQELKEQLRIKALVAEEYRRQREEQGLDEQVLQAIKATHTADLTLQLIVLVDHFNADKEWVNEFLSLQRELLQQYDHGDVQLKQMQEHLKMTVGVDVEEYTHSVMVFAGLEGKK